MPLVAPASKRVVLIDRYGTNVVTWMNPATASVLAQLPVGTGFQSNPHDYVEVDGAHAFVSRYGTNPNPGVQPFDQGGDLLVIDTTKPAIVGRIAIPEEDPTLQPCPDVMAWLGGVGGEVVLTLGRWSADFSSVGDGRFVGVSPTTQAIDWTVDVTGLQVCGRLAVSPSGAIAAIACSSGKTVTTNTFDPSKSDIVIYDVTTTPPTELRRLGVAVKLGAALQQAIAFASEDAILALTYGGNATTGDTVFAVSATTGDVTPLGAGDAALRLRRRALRARVRRRLRPQRRRAESPAALGRRRGRDVHGAGRRRRRYRRRAAAARHREPLTWAATPGADGGWRPSWGSRWRSRGSRRRRSCSAKGGSPTPISGARCSSIRASRFGAAVLVGAALAVAGLVIQGLFRNPLADSSVLGTSAGATLGGNLAIVGLELWTRGRSIPGVSPDVVLPIGCLVGAVASLSVILALLKRSGDMLSIILTGFLLSSLFLSLGSLVTSIAQDRWELGRAVVAFALGGLTGTGPLHLELAAPLVVAGVVAAWCWGRPLDLLLSGDEEAASLGVDVGVVRRYCVLWVAVLTAGAVALGGNLAFVGLLVPHALRPILGVDHRRLVPVTALGGAVFVAACDLLARAIPARGEIPLGVVTGILGAPAFLVILLRMPMRAGDD